MANLCPIFKTYYKSALAYIKSFPIKRVVSISRAATMPRAQTTTTRTRTALADAGPNERPKCGAQCKT